MDYIWKPKTSLEKFGERIYNLLVENFSQTFFVGGMVRDLLLNRKIVDIDITTSAKPNEVINLLSQKGFRVDRSYIKFGTIIVVSGGGVIEVTTLRKDSPGNNRYPYVTFISSPKIDSERRDFTINSLYLSLKDNKILDFQNGLKDIKTKRLRFIGKATQRITQDPLRIIRAFRFALTLNFKLDKPTLKLLKNNFYLTKNLTALRTQKEINKLKNTKQKNILKKVLSNPKLLDKYFK